MNALERSWYQKFGWSWLLLPLSLLFWLLSALRRQAFRLGLKTQQRLRVPVVVVGNISVGGTGKTPVTLRLCELLQAHGWRPGIISRGYGRAVPGVRAVKRGDSPSHVGDEPLLYAEDGFPVYVGERRVAAAQALLAANPAVDILIADDGLQHYALSRDVEIVVFDSRGIGNGQLLPAGPLREGLNRLGSPRVKGLVFQGKAQALPFAYNALLSSVMTLMPAAVYALNNRERTCSLSAFTGQAVNAIAGIGHPERFFQMLRDHGLHVTETAFPDHHRYTAVDIPITSLPVLMTEKDAVKCHEFSVGHDNWFVVPVTAQMMPQLPLEQWLSALPRR